MRKPKVVIVGAGPSGGACALALAMSKQAEVVLVDRSKGPRVKVCGSGLSPHALNVLGRLDLLSQLAPRHAPITALNATAPGGGHLRVSTGAKAWVVPRAELDRRLAQTAVAFGATLQEETEGLALLHDPSGQVRGLKTSRGDLEADLVVCADGSPSRFSDDPRPKRRIQTLMGWWRGASFPEGEASMVWDRRLAGYYAWVFPEPAGIVNVGVTIPEEAPDADRLGHLFQELLDEHFAEGLGNAEPQGEPRGRAAVVSTTVGKIIDARALWVGESARLVSPGTLEGISFALESGVTAATHIGRHFGLQRGFSPLAQRGYQALTAARMLPKFWAGEAFSLALSSARARDLGRGVMRSPIRPLIERGIAHLFGSAEG